MNDALKLPLNIAQIRISVIGCGKLGRAIGRLLFLSNRVSVIDIVNRSLASGQQAVDFIGSGRPCLRGDRLAFADIYLIATPDDHIKETCQDIVKQLKAGYPGQTSIFVHFSGALTSAVLQAAAQQGHGVASVHPARSFADPAYSVQTFPGTFCAFEGCARARSVVVPLFEQVGGTIGFVRAECKPLYHAAAVFAHNYTVTLAQVAQTCYEQAGIETHTARQLVQRFQQDALAQMERLPAFAQALTGPLKRKDWCTVASHDTALAAFPQGQQLYRALAEATLSVFQLGALPRNPAKEG